MAKSDFTVEINPAVLQWARETAGHTPDAVADRLRISKQTISQWETGQKAPEWKSLRKLAGFYQRPVGALLLPKPPHEPVLPPDFRTVPVNQKALSSGTLIAIRTARWLQTRALEMQRDLHIDSEFTTEKIYLTDKPEIIAKTCREALGIELSEQTRWKSEYEAYRAWRNALEAQGALVFQFRFPLEEVRGFSLFNRVRPVIVVNELDVVQARIFTLFHEYAHLLLQKPGICLPQETITSSGSGIEPFCNRFAAALLIPDSVARSWTISETPTDDDLRELARHYRVSKFVVLVRLKSIGRISDEAFGQIFSRWRSQQELRQTHPREPGGGGASAVQICQRQRGNHFISLVLKSVERGMITAHDAVLSLGVKLNDLDKLD